MSVVPADPSAALDRLTALHPKIIDLSLDRVWRLLAALGNPQDHLPPVVHVAGTNGKGSTVATLRACLEAAGKTVHVYTSPHLVRFNERIRLAGEIISDAALVALLEEVEAANAGQPITFFEVTTCAAFLAFSRTPADVVLLETGLGGRLDATNVVTRPAATVLTSISLDHQQYLGETLASIAAEKAEIMRPGVPCIAAAHPAEAAAVVDQAAARIGAVLWREGRDFTATAAETQTLSFVVGDLRLTLPRSRLPGDHQIQNAGLALAVLTRVPELAVPEQALRDGLPAVEWPARLQPLSRGPLVEALPQGWDLWLDGGHNPDAGERLAAYLRQQGETRPLDLVVGMIDTKDEAGFLRPLLPLVQRVRTVPVLSSAAGRLPQAVAETARGLGAADVSACDSVAAAVAALVADQTAPRRVLICGSLYLAGDVLATNG
ncbi:bifunctional folylpolyglutamate synthase/dihydrofolate synthase [Novispirillum itersonii]|uniref:Dihydrofolate synthase/folylpolyglutamate synthase n=1 Tax=Novispirillum itersonii TaxID=189 RepID=A0A7X0DLC9_NOVIT|nr:folylpolyglutamate synthase/dihydrofolate synthase family protein [Novispirillum itersonii]MBB6209898.1 dihydrofolate synthase/folylpolyglutamate synthase [Novispirillum itersonii]